LPIGYDIAISYKQEPGHFAGVVASFRVWLGFTAVPGEDRSSQAIPGCLEGVLQNEPHAGFRCSEPEYGLRNAKPNRINPDISHDPMESTISQSDDASSV